MTKKEVQQVAKEIRWEMKVGRKYQMLRYFIEEYGVQAMLSDIALEFKNEADPIFVKFAKEINEED